MKRKYYKKYETNETNEPVAIISEPEKREIFNFNFEDIVILVLIFLMLSEEKPDYLTIAALGFIFFE